MSHFTPAELKLHAELVAVIEEALGAGQLHLVVMLFDAWPEFHFLGALLLGFALVLFLLGLLVFPFADVANPANRWVGIGCNLDQIESFAPGELDSVSGLHDAELFVGRPIDDANTADANTLIDPRFFAASPSFELWFSYGFSLVCSENRTFDFHVRRLVENFFSECSLVYLSDNRCDEVV